MRRVSSSVNRIISDSSPSEISSSITDTLSSTEDWPAGIVTLPLPLLALKESNPEIATSLFAPVKSTEPVMEKSTLSAVSVAPVRDIDTVATRPSDSNNLDRSVETDTFSTLVKRIIPVS